MRSRKILHFILFAFLCLQTVSFGSDWTNMERSGNIAYFFVSDPARVERYDVAARSWLPALVLPSSHGPLTCGAVDGEGIYTAYDKAVYRYSLTGTGEAHLVNAADTVGGLFTDGNLLLINHSTSLYGKVVSVNKTTNTIIASFETYIDSVFGASIVRSLNRLVGTTRGISPADVTYLEYRDDGTFVGAGDSPHHGDYTIGTRTWTFPNEGRFVDTTGSVYNTSSLSYSLSFGSAITDLSFLGADVPIVLNGAKVTAYTNTLLPAGSATLSSTAKNIIANGDSIIAFKTVAGDGIGTEIIPLSQLNAPVPGQPASPQGLSFVPDDVFVDNSGVVCLFSKAHQTIFRWDPATQTYIAGIPLIGGPDFVAYTGATNTIYTAYTSGLIRKIDMGSTDRAEVPFAQLPSAPLGLSTAGNYLFACDGSGAWVTHYIYNPAGAMVASKDWNYYSRSYVWNNTNQKMYFFRDDTSPNDLLWEEINASGSAYPALAAGALGTYKDSPIHGDGGFIHPIRPSADGTVVALGSGALYAGVTLERKTTSLANSFTDAAWGTNGLYSMRSISGLTQFQQWLLPSYGQGVVVQIPGTPRRILPLANGRFFASTNAADGVPSFYILDQQFNIVAPPVLPVPANVAASVNSTSQIQVSWRDGSGETSYRIERRTLPDGQWQTAGTTTMGVTSFVDSTVQLGNNYAFRVFAVNGAQFSSESAAVEIQFNIPATPSITAGVVSASQIRIDWVAPARAISYKLYRSTTGAWTLVNSPAAGVTTYLDSSLAAGTTYKYKLQAVNALGSSPDSEVVTATTSLTAPDVPYLYSPSATGPTSVSMSWSGGARAENFLIERRLGTSGAWSTVATLTGTTFQYSDSPLQPETTYNYRMAARNVVGTSAYSTIRSVATPAIPVPTSPENLDALPASGTRIDLTWSDSANENGYRIERQIGESSWTVLTSLPANTTTYSDTTVSQGNYYNYRVVAFNVRGEAESAPIRVQAANVGSLVAEDFDPSITYPYWAELSGASVISGSQGFHAGNALWMGGNNSRLVSLSPVDLSMGGVLKFMFRAGNSAVDGTTRWENSEAGESVVLVYSTNNGSWEFLSLINTEYPSLSAWTSYEITLPTGARSANTRFRWYQFQHSGAGFDTWALDDIEIKGVLPDVPEAPPFIMGSANSSTMVSLSWVAGARATSYLIERRTPESSWEAIGTAGIGQNYFTDATARPATMYSYRVVSRNANGDSPPSSYVIVSTWSTFAEWRFQNYGTLSNSGIAGALEDNGTGVPNLVRFAFNMAADEKFFQVADSASNKGLPNIQMHAPNGLLRVAFIRRRPASNPGISYNVEFSGNASQWSAAGQEILSVALDQEFEYVVWEDSPAEAGKKPDKRFARVRVTE